MQPAAPFFLRLLIGLSLAESLETREDSEDSRFPDLPENSWNFLFRSAVGSHTREKKRQKERTVIIKSDRNIRPDYKIAQKHAHRAQQRILEVIIVH